ncbi:MAG: hypothetical protein O3A74_07775 [archaeon]|nr:hypothetical protein [archaeon]MDA0842933.1 hypothetical protein [archaeon]
MSDDMEELVDQRLAVFDDEPDLNDWVEIMCGAAMAVLGIFHLVSPGDLVDENIMRWFASSVVAAGAIWAGHGLKDMAVKEVRRSIALMDIANQNDEVNHGLIRDVLLNPEAYTEFLMNAYDSAWEDGVITDSEYEELRSFQKALGITDEDAAKMNVQAAVKSAAKDGEITDAERSMIQKAAEDAMMDVDEVLEDAESKAKKKD